MYPRDSNMVPAIPIVKISRLRDATGSKHLLF